MIFITEKALSAIVVATSKKCHLNEAINCKNHNVPFKYQENLSSLYVSATNNEWLKFII
jgi:hypothetical protein